jgi:hypothetical protein
MNISFIKNRINVTVTLTQNIFTKIYIKILIILNNFPEK